MLFDAATFYDKENNISFDTNSKIIPHEIQLSQKMAGKSVKMNWVSELMNFGKYQLKYLKDLVAVVGLETEEVRRYIIITTRTWTI